MAGIANEHLELLSLEVGGDSFAVNITDVQEIRVLEGLRKMPDAPPGWLGVIDFRDAMVPIADLRLVFKAAQARLTDKTVVVVMQSQINQRLQLVGLVVDAVSDVMQVVTSAIRQPPDVHNQKHSVITGLFKHSGHIVLMLDIERLLAARNFEDMHAQIRHLSDDH